MHRRGGRVGFAPPVAFSISWVIDRPSPCLEAFENLPLVLTAPLFERDSLIAGQKIAGPALVVEPDSTIYVPSDAEAKVDGFGNLLIQFIG